MATKLHHFSPLAASILMGTMALCSTTAWSDTNFVQILNQKWAEHDANILLEFVEASAATNPCLETIAAKGVIYGTVLGWGVAATNLFEEAKVRALTIDGSRYTDEEKAGIGRCINFLQMAFVSMAEMGGGNMGNVPVTNATHSATMFQSSPDKPLFADYLELFSTLGNSSTP